MDSGLAHRFHTATGIGPFSCKKPSRDEQPGYTLSAWLGTVLEGVLLFLITYSSIKPNKDFIAGIWILRWDEPEVQFTGLIGV